MTDTNRTDRNGARRISGAASAQLVYDAVVSAYINDISGRQRPGRREPLELAAAGEREMDLEAA